VRVGAIIGVIDSGAQAKASPSSPAAVPQASPAPALSASSASPSAGEVLITPVARRLAEEKGIDPARIKGTGPSGRIGKEDVLKHAEGNGKINGSSTPTQAQLPMPATGGPVAPPAPAHSGPPISSPRSAVDAAREERVRMTPLRKRVAERLLQAQSNAAILTTFNEVDMGAVMDLRKVYQERFQARHGIKLGFMSFFVKACTEALKAFPVVNAEIDGDDVIFKHYYDIGVAVAGSRGLVVPVLRDADKLGLADLEKQVADLGNRARTDKLKLEDLQGGTFSITNGGIFGSMLSTPIINPPQSGILGMHNIQDRAVVRAGQVVVRPMMYVALSYDHRLIDGKEAVQFLVKVKDCIEDPQRLLLEV
jgi:2-oxoglutarate dehydrogenase E2 component (dihydrolipoamide succinyltransferase)